MKILLRSPMTTYSGYGNDGIGLAQALMRWGADVYLQATHVDAPLPQDVANLLTKELKAPFDLYINHIDPSQLECPDEIERTCEVTVGWTMWEYCVDEATEIFTPRGWLRWDQVQVGDSSLAIDPFTGESSWQKITEVFIGPERSRSLPVVPLGQMGGVLTTPDHRWLVQDNKGHLRWTTTETMKTGHGVPRSAPRADLPVVSYVSDAVVELVAWAYTEGWLERGLSLRIGQSQTKNPGKVVRIREALRGAFGDPVSRNNPHSGTTWSEATRKDGMVIFSLSRLASLQILKDAPGKTPSREFLLTLTQRQLDLFLDVSVLADGWVDSNGVQRFGQNKGDRLDAFEFAAVLAGRTLSIRYGDKACVEIATSKTGRLYHPKTSKDQQFEEQEYVGRVWCPTLKHHNWLARHNGTVFFTGNTNFGNMPKPSRNTLKKRLKNFDTILGYSDVDMGCLQPYYKGKLSVLQGGFDPTLWPLIHDRDWDCKEFRFFMLGVLSERKDPFRCINAFSAARAQDEEFRRWARLSLKTTSPGLHHMMEDLFRDTDPETGEEYTALRIFYEIWPTDLVRDFYRVQHMLISPSRGEGKNVPALEFMSTGGSAIATNWAGHTQWLNPEYSFPLDYTLEPVNTDCPETFNARASEEHLTELMLHAFHHRAEVQEKGLLASQIIPQAHSWDAVVEKMFQRLKDTLPPEKSERLWTLTQIARSEGAQSLR